MNDENMTKPGILEGLDLIEDDYQRLKEDACSLVPEGDSNTAFQVDTLIEAIEANVSLLKSILDKVINK